MSAEHALRVPAILSSCSPCCCFGNYVRFSHHPFRKSCCVGHSSSILRIYSSDNTTGESHPFTRFGYARYFVEINKFSKEFLDRKYERVVRNTGKLLFSGHHLDLPKCQRVRLNCPRRVFSQWPKPEEASL